MSFFALSHMPPELASKTAISWPLKIAPAKKPPSACAPTRLYWESPIVV